MSFAAALDLAVRSADLTMQQVAQRTGLPASTLSRLRTGLRKPTQGHLKALAKALRLPADELARWQELALVDRAPAELRERLKALPPPHGEGFHDGWWLGYCRNFRGDGRIQVFLARFHKDSVLIQVLDRGILHNRYPGTCEILGDAIFLRATEDRGGSEHLQIILHSLFAFREPTVLHGVVCGISARDLADPVSLPCAARVLFCYAGDLALPNAALRSLQAACGAFPEDAVDFVWPDTLGDGAAVRRALAPAGKDLREAILRLTDNHLAPDEHVLRGGLPRTRTT